MAAALAAASPGQLTEELERICGMDIAALRDLWRRTFRSSPPAALSRDMLARILTYHLQERHLGGLTSSQRTLLAHLAKGGRDDVRRLKVGTVLVREYQGTLHEVAVVPGGFHWQGQTYASLSASAKAITGISWNGPRFFGLRGKAGLDAAPQSAEENVAAKEATLSRRGRRAAIRAQGDGGQIADGGA